MNKNYFIIFLLSCWLPLNLSGQQLDNLLLSNQQVNKQTLELTITPEFDNAYFVVGIVKGEKVISKYFFARVGRHLYELRNLPEWSGKIDYVATNLPRSAISKSRLVQPNMLDEFDIFLETEPLSPKTINFQKPIFFLGYPFTITLLIVFFISSIVFYFFRKEHILLASFIGLLIASIFMDLRSQFEHKQIIQYVERTYPYIEPITLTQKFIQKIDPIIGLNHWTFQGKFTEEYYKLFIKYKLSDRYYVQNTRKKLPLGTFIITEQPKNGQDILIQEASLYLVK